MPCSSAPQTLSLHLDAERATRLRTLIRDCDGAVQPFSTRALRDTPRANDGARREPADAGDRLPADLRGADDGPVRDLDVEVAFGDGHPHRQRLARLRCADLQ